MDGLRDFFVSKTQKHQKMFSMLYLEGLKMLRALPHAQFEANPDQQHSMQ